MNSSQPDWPKSRLLPHLSLLGSFIENPKYTISFFVDEDLRAVFGFHYLSAQDVESAATFQASVVLNCGFMDEEVMLTCKAVIEGPGVRSEFRYNPESYLFQEI